MTGTATPQDPTPTRTLACPSCGQAVAVRVDDLHRVCARQGRGLVTPEQLAHALCGCYVLDMPSSGLARLIGGILGS